MSATAFFKRTWYASPCFSTLKTFVSFPFPKTLCSISPNFYVNSLNPFTSKSFPPSLCFCLLLSQGWRPILKLSLSLLVPRLIVGSFDEFSFDTIFSDPSSVDVFSCGFYSSHSSSSREFKYYSRESNSQISNSLTVSMVPTTAVFVIGSYPIGPPSLSAFTFCVYLSPNWRFNCLPLSATL